MMIHDEIFSKSPSFKMLRHGTSFLSHPPQWNSVLSTAIPCDSSHWVAVRQRIIRKIKIIIRWQEHCWQPRIICARCLLGCCCSRKLWQFNYAAQWSTIHIHCILQLCMLQCVCEWASCSRTVSYPFVAASRRHVLGASHQNSTLEWFIATLSVRFLFETDNGGEWDRPKDR